MKANEILSIVLEDSVYFLDNSRWLIFKDKSLYQVIDPQTINALDQQLFTLRQQRILNKAKKTTNYEPLKR